MTHTRTQATTKIAGKTTALIVCLAGLLTASRASAVLPPDVVTAPTPNAAAIESYLNDQVTKLKSDNAADQKTGREGIANFAGASTPSAGFKYAYSSAVNVKLKELATNSNFRVRLNAAIAAQQVATNVKNDQLVPAVKALLGDANEGVALWAVKAAKELITQSTGAQLVPAVLDTAKRLPSVSNQAYSALKVEPLTPAQVGAIQDLIEFRIGLYAEGLPPDPASDHVGAQALVSSASWKTQSAAERLKTAQAIADLACAVGTRVLVNPSNEQTNVLREVVKKVGGDAEAIGILENNAALQTAMSKLRNLPGGNPISVAAGAQSIYPALKAAFPNLTQPKNFVPTTAPAAAGGQ